MIPHRTTISRQVDLRAKAIKNDVVIPEIKKYVNRWGGSITSDMWTEGYTQTPYITVTCHYINNAWELVERTLATQEFDSDLRHTGINIKQELDKIMASFELKSNGVIFVSDRGANMLAAFKDYSHLSCSDHMINTVLTHVFDNKKIAESLPDVQVLLTSAKELVRYFKKSGLMQLLSKSLKQEVPTRWNSIHTMLSSVKESYDEVQHVLDTKSQRFRYL